MKLKIYWCFQAARTANRLLCLEPNKLKIIKAAAQEADICMMIANGSSVLAQTGLLYHRQIADYPGEENWKLNVYS